MVEMATCRDHRRALARSHQRVSRNARQSDDARALHSSPKAATATPQMELRLEGEARALASK